MADIKAYWQRHRAKVAELTEAFPSGFVKLTSEDQPALNVTKADPVGCTLENAARLLLQGGFHISTPEEIEIGNEHEQQRKRAGEAHEFKGDKKLHLVIDQRCAPVKGKK